MSGFLFSLGGTYAFAGTVYPTGKELDDFRCTSPGCPDRPTIVEKEGAPLVCYWCGKEGGWHSWLRGTNRGGNNG